VWRQATMKLERRRCKSGQTQCGKPPPPFEKEKNK
jgi:hypothetical protein